ncbi:inactive pancreatic lipase-related protein 1-like [Leptopilina boulardi]|uniref:inactive pancreatic lipase-related protein 1-like n=1 Tax=Leptopilina boulardi TaxID=63433 RepID=UPI0021F68954|nr:inactive pancreatic lipase-related protein 1-like [Leptopilina boulardi]
MTIISVFSCFTIIVTIGKCHVVKSSTFIDDDIYRFENEDTKIFQNKGLWFFDDYDNLIEATLNKSLLMSGDVNLNLNLENYVFFLLYTRENIENFQWLYLNDNVTLTQSNFNSKRPTRFITHGWTNSYKSPACTLIKDAFLEQGNYNVIVIDWSRISKGEYIYASYQVKKIGMYVAAMIDFLQTQGLDTSTTTLVGHSLGAHVMGLAGYHSLNIINYIVGLDPAWPLFGTASEGSRISSNDADNVEIIHTNAGYLGYKTDIGDADFYPNGGISQIGCLIDVFGICSHKRAIQLYAESILSKDGFYGKKCDDYDSYQEEKCNGEIALMGGIKKNFKFKGKFFLHTRDKPPFAVGHN